MCCLDIGFRHITAVSTVKHSQDEATYQTLVLFMFPHLTGSGYIIAVPTVISYFVVFLSLAVPGHMYVKLAVAVAVATASSNSSTASSNCALAVEQLLLEVTAL